MEAERPGRALFWTLGMRVPEHNRLWVREQLLDPRFSQRRVLGTLGLQLAVVSLPNLVIGLVDGSATHLLLAGLSVVGLGLAAAGAVHRGGAGALLGRGGRHRLSRSGRPSPTPVW